MWFLVFFSIPIVEMYLLIEVAERIEALPTILLVMLTAVLGVSLIRQQGLSTLTKGIRRLNQAEIPAAEIIEGVLLAVAGAFLITPGFLTDFIGFMIIIPITRRITALMLLKRMAVRTDFRTMGSDLRGGSNKTRDASGSVIEGEYEKKDQFK